MTCHRPSTSSGHFMAQLRVHGNLEGEAARLDEERLDRAGTAFGSSR